MEIEAESNLKVEVYIYSDVPHTRLAAARLFWKVNEARIITIGKDQNVSEGAKIQAALSRRDRLGSPVAPRPVGPNGEKRWPNVHSDEKDLVDSNHENPP